MSTPIPPHVQVRDLVIGSWKAQAVYVAARLALADLVKDGPRSAEDLAKATGTHAPSLYRLLRALASIGIFAEQGDGRFASTPLAECLRSDLPGGQRALAIMMGEEHYGTWAELLYSIQTGRPAFDHCYGQPVFEYLADHPDAAKTFDAAMTGIHGPETRAMAAAYDFSAFGTLVDIGGGNGSLLVEVLRQHPALKGILFDRQHVIERARENLRAAGLDNRCQVVAGDFFQSVPEGGDAYLMRHIIHDWDDDQSNTILKNCRRAMKGKSRLLVVENVIPPGNNPCFGKWLDLNMLALPGGKERTTAEYQALYAAAGFRLTRVVPTQMEISLIEGEPA
jgi:ubiquinone/menaquinone biosynthesis C-methylase UbiE